MHGIVLLWLRVGSKGALWYVSGTGRSWLGLGATGLGP